MRKILVVDDNEDILAALRALLKFSGYEVETADRGEQVRSKIGSFAPDLIFLDIMLSGTNGCDICRSIKQSEFYRHIPVIMISAHPHGGALALECGANDFIPKPFDLTFMLDKIKLNTMENKPLPFSA